MALKLNSNLDVLYNLPWYEYYEYMKIVEDEEKARLEDGNVHQQEKYEIQKGNIRQIGNKGNKVNLPDNLRG